MTDVNKQMPEDEKIRMKDLTEWNGIAMQMKQLRSREGILRSRLYRRLFLSPVEGSKNKIVLPHGFVLQLKYELTRKVDEAALLAGKDLLAEHNIPSNVFEYKPQLSKTVYNALTQEQKDVVDQFLKIQPGSPQLSVETPAAVKKAIQRATESGQALDLSSDPMLEIAAIGTAVEGYDPYARESRSSGEPTDEE